MKAILVFFLCMIVYLKPSCAQLWQFPEGKNRVEIPFEFINNLIVISVQLNNESLSFILDNGVKETLLFGQVDSLHLKNTSSYVFQGFGIGKPIEGLMSKNNKLVIGNAVDSNHHLYVVTDTTFNLSKNIGVYIHGIIGSTFFRNNVVAINYVKRKIILARHIEDLGIRMSKYHSYPLLIENDRAYLKAAFKSNDQQYDQQKVLLDLGNSDPMLLFANEIENYKISTPYIRDYLGFGFNGAVYGLKNRIEALFIGDYKVKLPIVSYPDSDSYDRTKIAKDRVGSIGNQILSRFYLVFDYPNNKLYARSNRNFKKPYTLDMSGIEVVHGGFEFVKHRVMDLTKKGEDGSTVINFSAEVNYIIELHNNYLISEVRPDSPAQNAGLQIGDKLLKINGKKVGTMKLQAIKSKLQAGQNKLIKIQISRNQEIKDFEFRLVDPLYLP